MKEKQPITQVCRETYERSDSLWNDKREAMNRLSDALAGEWYEDDHSDFNKDRRLVQVRGQETQDSISHVVAILTSKPRSLEARPIDQIGDPDQAEVEVALVDGELSNPRKRFDVHFEAALQSACEVRLGAVMMDWHPDSEPFGEIFFRYVDPRMIRWDPDYDSPHDPLCPWFLEEKRLDVNYIHRTWKGTEWVTPDSAGGHSSLGQADKPLLRGAAGHNLAGRTRDDNKATLWFWWWKIDPDYRPKKQEDDTPLEPEERYMSCANGCGYRSETQGSLRKQGKLEGPELPPEVDFCPTCADQGMEGTQVRIDAVPQEQALHAISAGKKLVIMAPMQHGAPDDKPIYQGKWPIPKARSVPGLFLTASIKPGDVMGPSYLDRTWDQQIAANQLRTMAIQRVFEHRNYFVSPGVGLVDAAGNRFECRDDQGCMLFRDQSQAQFGALDVQLLNPVGLDPNFGQVFSITQDALTRFRPAADFGPAEENTRDIAVGTTEMIVQQAEIQTAHLKRRINREVSCFAGVVSDYIHATYTPARLARLNIDGMDLLVNLWGQDLPNYDFVIEDAPEFTGLEEARAKAWDAGVQVAMTAPMLLEPWGKFHRVPRSVVRELQKAVAAQMAQVQGQVSEMDAGGGEGMPAEAMEGDPGQEQMNGSGMVPEFQIGAPQ